MFFFKVLRNAVQQSSRAICPRIDCSPLICVTHDGCMSLQKAADQKGSPVHPKLPCLGFFRARLWSNRYWGDHSYLSHGKWAYGAGSKLLARANGSHLSMLKARVVYPLEANKLHGRMV